MALASAENEQRQLPGLYVRTLRGLTLPRRAVPIALVSATMVFAETQLSRHPARAPLAVLACAVFVLTAPYLWRRLNPVGQTWPSSALRLLSYATAGFGVACLVVIGLPRVFGFGPMLLANDYTAYIALALFWVGGWGLGRDLDYEDRLAIERERAQLLEQEAERARLLALKSHLDPHFLFNTLNAIAEWCRTDGEVAERALLKLSDILRSVLSGVPLASWSLARELGLVEALLELHLVRDPNMFQVERQLRVDTSRYEVPPLILLPLVENAVKHGPAAGHPGTLRMEVSEQNRQLHIRLQNPGAFRGLRRGGQGFAMVRKRLRLAYGGRAELSIRDIDGSTEVELCMPGQGPEQTV